MKSRLLGLVVMMLLAAACSAPQSSAPDSSVDAEKLRVANEMVEAWNTLDWDGVYELFAEDGVLHSMMLEPIVGRQAIKEQLRYIEDGVDQIELRIINMGVVNDVVFLERVDDFIFNGHPGSVPVVGVMEIADGHVTQWRDYYDHEMLRKAMSPE